MANADQICARCKRRKALAGFSRCSTCRQAERVYWRSIREERRREGVCPECGKKPAKGRNYCATHLAYHAEAARAYRKRLAATKKKAAAARRPR